jgi:hypothetical protein
MRAGALSTLRQDSSTQQAQPVAEGRAHTRGACPSDASAGVCGDASQLLADNEQAPSQLPRNASHTNAGTAVQRAATTELVSSTSLAVELTLSHVGCSGGSPSSSVVHEGLSGALDAQALCGADGENGESGSLLFTEEIGAEAARLVVDVRESLLFSSGDTGRRHRQGGCDGTVRAARGCRGLLKSVSFEDGPDRTGALRSWEIAPTQRAHAQLGALVCGRGRNTKGPPACTPNARSSSDARACPVSRAVSPAVGGEAAANSTEAARNRRRSARSSLVSFRDKQACSSSGAEEALMLLHEPVPPHLVNEREAAGACDDGAICATRFRRDVPAAPAACEQGLAGGLNGLGTVLSGDDFANVNTRSQTLSPRSSQERVAPGATDAAAMETRRQLRRDCRRQSRSTMHGALEAELRVLEAMVSQALGAAQQASHCMRLVRHPGKDLGPTCINFGSALARGGGRRGSALDISAGEHMAGNRGGTLETGERSQGQAPQVPAHLQPEAAGRAATQAVTMPREPLEYQPRVLAAATTASLCAANGTKQTNKAVAMGDASATTLQRCRIGKSTTDTGRGQKSFRAAAGSAAGAGMPEGVVAGEKAPSVLKSEVSTPAAAASKASKTTVSQIGPVRVAGMRARGAVSGRGESHGAPRDSGVWDSPPPKLQLVAKVRKGASLPKAVVPATAQAEVSRAATSSIVQGAGIDGVVATATGQAPVAADDSRVSTGGASGDGNWKSRGVGTKTPLVPPPSDQGHVLQVIVPPAAAPPAHKATAPAAPVGQARHCTGLGAMSWGIARGSAAGRQGAGSVSVGPQAHWALFNGAGVRPLHVDVTGHQDTRCMPLHSHSPRQLREGTGDESLGSGVLSRLANSLSMGWLDRSSSRTDGESQTVGGAVRDCSAVPSSLHKADERPECSGKTTGVGSHSICDAAGCSDVSVATCGIGGANHSPRDAASHLQREPLHAPALREAWVSEGGREMQNSQVARQVALHITGHCRRKGAVAPVTCLEGGRQEGGPAWLESPASVETWSERVDSNESECSEDVVRQGSARLVQMQAIHDSLRGLKHSTKWGKA